MYIIVLVIVVLIILSIVVVYRKVREIQSRFLLVTQRTIPGASSPNTSRSLLFKVPDDVLHGKGVIHLIGTVRFGNISVGEDAYVSYTIGGQHAKVTHRIDSAGSVDVSIPFEFDETERGNIFSVTQSVRGAGASVSDTIIMINVEASRHPCRT